jgi:hypothetical protein
LPARDLFAVWLKLGLAPGQATGCAVLLILLLLVSFGRFLLPYGGAQQDTSLFAIPRGIVTYIGVICCLGFVVEGAMLDWSGVFLTELKGVDFSLAGTGFALFSAAMLSMRLTGDWLTQKLGGRVVVLYGTGGSGGRFCPAPVRPESAPAVRRLFCYRHRLRQYRARFLFPAGAAKRNAHQHGGGGSQHPGVCGYFDGAGGDRLYRSPEQSLRVLRLFSYAPGGADL